MYAPQNISSPVCNIERRKSLSSVDFHEHYFLKRPVIFTSHTKINSSRWSKHSLVSNFGRNKVHIGTLYALTHTGRAQYRVPLKKYIQSLSADGSFLNSSQLYLFDRNASNTLKELFSHYVLPEPFTGHSSGLTLTLGRSGTGLPFHYHHDGWLEV
jgi:hypothetical protein